MARPCSVCRHHRQADIAADFSNGATDIEIAGRYGLSRSAVQRHRQHMGAPGSATVSERKAQAFAALATLPTPDEVNGAYASIAARIDTIATKAESENSLAVALMGLRELRSTVTAQATLAGHIGGGATVAVQTNVNIDMGAAVKELIAAVMPKPVHDPAIPAEVARVLDQADKPDASMLERLGAILDQ
jgi:hypothetical protein